MIIGRRVILIGFGVALGAEGCKSEAAPPRVDPQNGVEIIRPVTLTEEARFPEVDPNVTSVEVSADRLVFVLRGPLAVAVAPGNVIAGATSGGYLRRVKEIVSATDARVEVVTEPAELVDLIADGAFTARTFRGQTAWTRKGLYGESASGIETKFQVFPVGGLGFECGEAQVSNFEFSPILDIDFDTEVKIDIRRPSPFTRPVLHYALFALTGELHIGSHIKSSGAYSVECTLKWIELLAVRAGDKNLFTIERPQLLVVPGIPVPVPVVHSIAPLGEVTIAGQSTTDFLETHSLTTFRLRMGAEHEDNVWSGIWTPERTSVVTASLPSGAGEISLSAAHKSGIEYKVLVAGAAGPKIAFEAPIEAKLTANAALCRWSATTEGGANVEIGAELNVPVIDRTLAEWTATFNLTKEAGPKAEGTFASCSSDGGVAMMTDGGPSMPPPGPDPCVWYKHETTASTTPTGQAMTTDLIDGTDGSAGASVRIQRTLVATDSNGTNTNTRYTEDCSVMTGAAGSCVIVDVANSVTSTRTIAWAGSTRRHDSRFVACANADPAGAPPPVLLNNGTLYSWLKFSGQGIRTTATYQSFDSCAVPDSAWLSSVGSCRCVAGQTQTGPGWILTCD